MLERIIDKIKLVNFKDFTKSEIELVYKWRNDPKIAKYMVNKHIDLKEHLSFIKSLKNSSDKRYFLVYQSGEPIGVVSFVNISEISCEFGIYANPNLRQMGNILMSVIIDYAFDILKVSKILAKAYKDNLKAINLYQKFKFEIYENSDLMVYFCRKAK